MKKRFTLMMMVLCFLMSIPLKMMAQTGTNEKLYLIGGLTDGWTNDETRPFTTTDGKIYEYVFTADYTNNLPAESADYYFRVKTASQQYQPQNDGDFVKTTFTKADEGSSIAWKLTMTKGKSYTLIFDLTNKQIKYSEGGSEVVTKVIKLLNGSDELTCSNGKYTLDLSSATADATITLNIGGENYGLADAKTIDAVGTTSDIAFTTGGTEALTLKAGLVYSITVTDEGKMTVVASVDTTKNNPLPKRTYTQGYYLAGNFFSFSGEHVTYDDAVFKFHQQKNATIEEVEYAVYKVEIPASLTAHAQVMSVNELGEKQKVYGPGSAHGICYTNPTTEAATALLPLTGSEIFDETLDGTLDGRKNYWDIKSRNERADEYSDGMYEVFIYIPVKSSTGEPTMWQFKHIGKKRVAFFISNAKNATAMPVYDTYKKNYNQFSNKFFASVNLSTEHSYYVISNYVLKKDYDWIKHTSSQYGTLAPNGDVVSCPTTNKLFLLGNGGYPVETADDHNQFSPNEKPMIPADNQQGSRIIEYNCSNGNDNDAKKAEYLGIRGQVIIRGDADKQINSISMVGDAIPGTVKDGVWDYTSTAADMTYDETEKCYKVTLVITDADYGTKKFRFVGNHKKDFNWHEDSKDDASMMAKVPYDGNGEGHAATTYDPNKVNYTDDGLKVNSSDDDWGIIWNRPAGRWTVRLYFYTYNVGADNGDNIPKTEYYYTISANRELELRDFEDVVYMSKENKRNILLRGGYKYFRSWSAVKAWKISNYVDIFVVDGMKEGADGKAKFTLKKITADPTNTYNVIPSNTGVILATKKTAADIKGAEVFERASLTSYNTMVIPMEEYNPTTETTSTDYKEKNLLQPLIEAKQVPTMEHTTYNNVEGDYYNYLFGFYHAKKGLGVTEGYNDNDFLLGFWLSNGIGAFYNNSAYLPIDKATADKMKLGVSYDDFGPSEAKKVPALFFDFANADGTTGIDEVVNSTVKNHDGKYYTLSGQQVEKPTAGGVYIHNGKKFVVK
jgi:secreted alpha-amylase